MKRKLVYIDKDINERMVKEASSSSLKKELNNILIEGGLRD